MSNVRAEQERSMRGTSRRGALVLTLLMLALPAGVTAEEAQKRSVRSDGEESAQPRAQQAPPEHASVLRGAERSAPVTPFVLDLDLRNLPGPVPWRPGDPVKEIPRRHYPKPGVQGLPLQQVDMGPDPLLARQAAAVVETIQSFATPSRNFAGQGFTGVNPPDTVGDVGPDHYIQMINASDGAHVRIWDKAEPTPSMLASFVLDSQLGTGSCASGWGDPVVLYDRLADRWLLSEFSSSGNYLCVYISQSGDPVAGGWFAYAFQAPSFPDYPKYGVWPTDANSGSGSYIVTANDGGPGVYALDRGKMLAGQAATFQRFSISNLPGFGFESPTPADLDGPNAPPAGAAAIIMRHRDTEVHGPVGTSDVLEWWLFDVDWIDEQNTTIAQQPGIDVSNFDSDLCGTFSFSCFPQPSGQLLDPLREVIMFRLQYRNSDLLGEVLAGNFVVDVDLTDHGGLRWFELRKPGGSWELHQEGTFAPDSDHRWMAASATDQSGNFAIGYNVASSTTHPSLRYSGRLWDDPLGQLTQGDLTIHAGTASNGSNRYGDYAAMSVDPADDCTFWFTGMDNIQSVWRTQIASFRFETCGCDLKPSPVVLTAEAVVDNEIEIGWNDADLETVTEYLVKRSRTQKGPYELIATVPDTSPGVAGGPDTFYTDTDVSGGTTYYYVVRASDGQTCISDESVEVNTTATGECTLQPVFSGLESITAPFLETCELRLAWSPATDECGGPLSYNVYRSTVPDFTPDASTLLAAGLTTSAFVDFDQLLHGTDYYYIVRAVDAANGKEDDNLVQLFDRPRGIGGPCTTVSACPDNPYVNVQPDGPLSGCAVSGFTLNAFTSGGAGSFSYQWMRDGVDIPGATDSSYSPTDLNVHAYNVKVQSDLCSGVSTDPLDTEVDLVDAPSFDGVAQVINPQTSQCSLEVAWDAGTTVCPGPVRYFVYRSTTSPVATTQENLIAAGISSTGYTDTADLISDTIYYYLVRAQDASTGQFDTNLIEAAASPDGPGSGTQTPLNDNFEDGSTFADWSVTTGPGAHTCGEWARSDLSTSRPGEGSGFYAVADNDCNPVFARTSTTLTSPVVDSAVTGLVSATLEYDLWFNFGPNGQWIESGKVEVFDGSSWSTVWEDGEADFDGHGTIDVTAAALGNSSFQVRFDYQDANNDSWMSVDNVVLTTLAEVQCATAPAGPAAVPDGISSTSPLLGSRTTPTGDVIDVSWDVSSCPATSYNLLYGDMADVDRMTLLGSECSLGTSGSFTWNAVPAGDLFFLVVATDGATTEGGWGLDGYGGERNGLNASGECGVSFKDASRSCP